MDTKALVEHYGSLSVIERLRMIHDADKRGDTSESRNLENSGPRWYSMTDTMKLENELRHLATYHYAHQMEIAAEFWYAQTRASWAIEEWDEATNIDPNAVNDQEHERRFQFWSNVAKFLEFRYVYEKSGWDLFIEQSGFDVTRIDVMPKSWLLKCMDENAVIHPDIEDAVRWITKRDEPITLRTPDDAAKRWHDVIDDLAKHNLLNEPNRR